MHYINNLYHTVMEIEDAVSNLNTSLQSELSGLELTISAMEDPAVEP